MDVTAGHATRKHKTQTEPLLAAASAAVGDREFDSWDDPNLEIALTESAEEITVDVNAFMAYLELDRARS